MWVGGFGPTKSQFDVTVSQILTGVLVKIRFDNSARAYPSSAKHEGQEGKLDTHALVSIGKSIKGPEEVYQVF